MERLRDAQDDQARLRRAADDARGTAGEDAATTDVGEGADRLAAREAWLTWVERGF